MSRQPNIVLITTDQQRFDTVGPHAPTFLRTPHLDHLSRDGVMFSHAYSDCPVCIPARTTIMTGLHAHHHGLTGNQSGQPIDRDESLPTRMRHLGYQTAAIGKMHFEPMRARYGFEEMILPDDYYYEMERTSGVGKPMQHGLGQTEIYPTLSTVPESYTLTAWTVDQSVEYIKRRRDPQLPFFLWCSFSKPHPPFDPPEPYYSMYLNANIPEPWKGDWVDSEDCPDAITTMKYKRSTDVMSPEILKASRAAYYGLITQIDYNIGRLLAALHDIDEYKDTLIIFTSDHGELLGDHCLSAKSLMLEGSSHIPMIIRYPKSWQDRPVGITVEEPVCLADMMATCVAAGGGTAEDTDGQNLVALASGKLEKPREWIEASQGYPDAEWYGITNGIWKYIYYFRDGKEQLFHLEKDPHELVNLSRKSEYEATLKQYRDRIIDSLKQKGSNLVKEDRLIVRGTIQRTEKEWRSRSHLGLHTSTYPHDVRH